MNTTSATWYVVCGTSPNAWAVQPELAGIDIPGEILDWAAGHGLSLDNPDVYLMVAPADEAGDLIGEVAYINREMSGEDMASLRAELDATN